MREIREKHVQNQLNDQSVLWKKALPLLEKPVVLSAQLEEGSKDFRGSLQF